MLKTPSKKSRWRNSYKYNKQVQYYLLKNGDETVHVFFNYRGVDYKKSIGRKKRDKITEIMAKRERDRWLDEVKMSRGGGSVFQVTFGELFDAYLFYARVHFRSWRAKQMNYEKHLRELLADEKCIEINDKKVLYVQHYLLDKGLKFSSVNVIVQTIPTVLNYAVKNGLLEHSRIRNFQKLKGVSLEKRFLRDEEVKKLLRDAQEEKEVHDFIALSLGLGARVATTLKIRTVDLKDDRLTLHDIKRAKDYTVALDRHTLNAKEILFAFPQSAKPIFAFKYEWIYRRVYKLLLPFNEGREDRATIHTFRHTFAYRVLREGLALHELRDRLNHSTITTTEMYYEHLVK